MKTFLLVRFLLIYTRELIFEQALSKEILNKTFGSKNWGSRIFVSHLYKEKENDNDYWLKIWGFIPKTVLDKNNLDLEEFQEEIHAHIKNNMFKSADLLMKETGKQLIEDVMKNE